MTTTNTHGKLNVSKTPEALTESLAAHIADLAKRAIADHGHFSVTLSGGSTPKKLYERLGQAPYQTEMPWDKIYIFIGDERCVPHSDTNSNWSMIDKALLSKINIPQQNLFPTEKQDSDPAQAAADYESKIRQTLKTPTGVPVFDLHLLGLGTNGHTASLFPDSKALQITDRLYVENYIPELDTNRLTATYPLLNAARNIIFLVEGEGKAQVLQEIFEQPEKHYAAQEIHPQSGVLDWFVDEAATSKLSKK